MVDGTLYLCTQTNIVVALDPETGKERWRFDPKVDPTGASAVTTCRGVAFHRVPDATDCPTRIITATFDARLIALDAKTGRSEEHTSELQSLMRIPYAVSFLKKK